MSNCPFSFSNIDANPAGMAGERATPTTMTTHRIPAPQAQAFVACRKITNDPQTGEIVINGTVSHDRYDPVEPLPPWEWRASERMRQNGFSHTKEQ